jgi:hypothetical protein
MAILNELASLNKYESIFTPKIEVTDCLIFGKTGKLYYAMSLLLARVFLKDRVILH